MTKEEKEEKAREHAITFLKLIGFLATADDVTAALGPALDQYPGDTTLGGGEVTASSAALFLSIVMFCHACGKGYYKELPKLWLFLVLTSAVVSLIGGVIVLSDQSTGDDSDIPTSDKVGTGIVVFSKILHPGISSFFYSEFMKSKIAKTVPATAQEENTTEENTAGNTLKLSN